LNIPYYVVGGSSDEKADSPVKPAENGTTHPEAQNGEPQGESSQSESAPVIENE